MDRRDFITASLTLAAGAAFAQGERVKVPARAVTKGPKHHFFGYYDKCPWDKSGRYLLGMENGFIDRQPQRGEALTLGMVDLKDGDRYIPFDATTAWAWQQGTMLQWMPSGEAVYNSVADGKYVSIIRDVHANKTRILPKPIYAVSADGRQAVTLPFDRLHRLRPGYGYCALDEEYATEKAPAKTGIWHMDMATGKHELIVPIAKLAAFQPDATFPAAWHWVNHLQFNPSGTRFIFLHRWKSEGDKTWQTRVFTVKPDGSDLRLHSDHRMVSHFDWRDDKTILAWAKHKEGNHFYLIDVDSNEATIIGGDTLKQDGHCSYSPDRKWILNDTYPDKDRLQWLMLFHPATGRRIDLNQFHLPKELTGPFRCDLHPRWNRDGTQVCIDSGHEATRQLYVLDVGGITKEG